MKSSTRKHPWQPARKLFTFSTLIIPFILVLVLPSWTESIFAQPTLKEVLEKKTKEDEEPKKAEPTPSETGATPENIPQAETKPAPIKKKPIPQDELERGVPRTSIHGFLEKARERDFEQAAEYLDLRNLPGNVKTIPGKELARQLYIVLNRSFLIDHEMLSTDPQGHLDDDLPKYRDHLGTITTPDKKFDLLLQHVPDGEGKLIWKFSNRTVKMIPELYEIFGHGYLDEVFPHWFFDFQIFEIYVWEWVAMTLAAMLSYVVIQLTTMPIIWVLRRQKAALIKK